ncbi:MAG TPA: GMC oxidoreductase [Bacillota bacterium]|nr:GMC oxidoreductase [Bacillota bacterium]
MKQLQENWDVIVIGTGPGGATAAKALAEQGKKVLILEKGGYDLGINIPKMLLKREMLFIGGGRTMVRGVRLGGSSVLYYGTAHEPPYQLFLAQGIDLRGEVKELKSELPIAVLPDHLMGPAASLIMKSAVELGFGWNKLEKFIYQDRCSPTHFPFEAQWNSLMFVDQAVAAGAVLVTGADVRKILTSRQQAAGVELLYRGRLHRVKAGTIVLAAGGHGSPIILQASGIRQAGSGFFCDPVVVVQGLTDSVATGKEIPMAAGMVSQAEGFIMTDLTLPRLVYQLFAAQALRPHRIFDHQRTAAIMIKVKDDLGGIITPSGGITKTFSQLDEQKMRLGIAQATAILQNAGVRKIFPTKWTSAHPGGSARIGEVVDANLETEYKNLYVCDCSVIPSAWGLPPVLTLMALAKRLARHLQ